MPHNDPPTPDDESTNPVNAALDRGGIPKPPNKTGKVDPAYQIIADTKIPVSKHLGKVWKARRDAGVRAHQDMRKAWAEAIRYYNHDQTGHRDGSGPDRVANQPTPRLGSTLKETENVVFANTATMLPVLYARNPKSEFTAFDKEKNKGLASEMEDLINNLVALKDAPGTNLKPKARRCVLTTLLTNLSWMEIGWTEKPGSREQALLDLQTLEKEYANAKSSKKITEIEGKLRALESMVDFLAVEGPFNKVLSPFNTVNDPESEEIDLSDSNWFMKSEMIATDFLRAKFGKQRDKQLSEGEIMSIFAPTHLLATKGKSSGGVDEEVNNFTLFEEDAEFKDLGFDNEEAFKNAQRTKTWFVWDKTTRRIFMFSDKDWTWPIWVWNDPYGLPRFFPFYSLHFHENTEGGPTKGEVTYYLDQQDAINDINDEQRRARAWAKRNVLFDKNKITQADVEQYLKGDDNTARGVDVPEGMKLSDVVGTVPPPSVKFPELFDKTDKFNAVDRVSSVSDVMRGVQFKTNTTNDAIENYNVATRIRLDERVDAIEEFLGDIMWGTVMLCAKFMSSDTVAAIIGRDPENWQQREPAQLVTEFGMRVVAGSTQKPTSAAKKKEAIEVGQVLGQFARAAPGPITEVMLRLFEQAFDEVVMTEEDWQKLRESVFQQQQRGNSTGVGGAGTNGTVPQQQGTNGADGAGQEQIKQAIQQLPPEAQQQLQALVQQGMPPAQALQQVLQSAQQPQ